jgi:uncharacterized protein (TIGR04255 family)
MAEPLPKFDAPPVVEALLGVQFAPLVGYTTPMAGWFWKSYLPVLSAMPWEKAEDEAPLEDARELFGENEVWGTLGFRLQRGSAPNRVQIIQSGDQRMVQVQNTRFILNWRKQEGLYPSFDTLSNEFWKVFPEFEKFTKETGLGAVEQNQWEVTYVNRISKGELWENPANLKRILPQFSLPSAVIANPAADPISFDWRYTLPDERGRLYIKLLHARSGPSRDAQEFIQITLTARGAIDHEKDWNLKSGFDLGHEAIVRTFAAITSPDAHKLWKRTA